MTHRVLLVFMMTILLAASAAAQTNAPRPAGTDVSAVVNPLFQNYCVSCHNETKKTAGLALDSLNTKDVSQNAAVWEKILRRLRTRRDPTIGAPRPGDAAYLSAVSALESALDHAYPNAALTAANRVSDA